ncbi:hypothetical protein AB0H51_12020 [Streptomyces griseoluteus]|uniref:hypothetical protein n=1 Tax=Streptomyces griseoluteus TaxID=29306 RepID=UPI00340C32B0
MLSGDRSSVARRLRGATTLLGSLSVCAAALAGCTAGVSTDQRASQPSEQRLRELTVTEELLVERAEQQLVKKCMGKAGFRFWTRAVETAASRDGAGFVLDDVKWARTYGYGGQFRRDAEKARRDGPNGAYENALPQRERARYREVLDGSPSRGVLSASLPAGGTVSTPRYSCFTQAKAYLYGDFATWFRVEKTATNLTPLYVPNLVKDKRFTKALAAWSRCMNDKGRHYSDPSDIRADLSRLTEGLSDTAAHAVEVHVAVDEAECARVSSLADTARTLEGEYRAKKTRRFRGDIAAYQRMRLAALDRAGKVVGT